MRDQAHYDKGPGVGTVVLELIVFVGTLLVLIYGLPIIGFALEAGA